MDLVTYRFGEWLVEPSLNQINRHQVRRHLEPQAMNLLVYLLARPGITVSTEEILTEVWKGRIVEPGAVARAINQIRHALDDSPREAHYIKTVSRRGYRTVAPVELNPCREPKRDQEGIVFRRPASLPYRRRSLLTWSVGGAFLLLLALLGLRAFDTAGTNAAQVPRRFTIELPVGLRAQHYQFRPVTISPDARVVIFSSAAEGTPQLYTRSLQSLEVQAIPGTEDALPAVTFSPDGRSIAFVSRRRGKLMRVAITGGVPVPVSQSDVPVLALSWSSDGHIAIETESYLGIMGVEARGGAPYPMTTPAPGEVHKQPFFHPQRNLLFFTIGERGSTTRSTDRIAVLSLDSGRTRILLEGSSPRPTADGTLVYYRDGALWSTRFDTRNLSVDGPGLPAINHVHYEQTAHYSLADDGTLVFVLDADLFDRPLVRVDRRGNETMLQLSPRPFLQPRISPDGRLLAFIVDGEGGADLWVHSLDQGMSTRLTNDESREASPLWGPGGDYLVYSSNRVDDLFKVDVTSGAIEQLSKSATYQFATSILMDGSVVISESMSNVEHHSDIMLVSPTRHYESREVLRTKFREEDAVVSPDGKLIAYVSDRSGTREVYVSPFPEVHRSRHQVSVRGGRQPAWTRAGRELIYWGPTSLMSVMVEEDAAGHLEFAESTRLFDHENFVYYDSRNFDVDPTGERFLLVRRSPREQFPSNRIVVVEHWVQALPSWN